MKLWRWQAGRQKNTKYKKLCLWNFRLFNRGYDCYILKYKPNTLLPWHTDPVPGGEHWRLNKTLYGFSSFFIKRNGRTECYTVRSAGWFRPDLYQHMLRTNGKSCVKLSIGFVKFEKKYPRRYR